MFAEKKVPWRSALSLSLSLSLDPFLRETAKQVMYEH
jgi:hypothetical protein